MDQNKSEGYKIERRPPNADFRIQSMEAIYQVAQGKTDVPHRHDYYTIFLVEEAKGKHIIDYQTYLFEFLEVHFVSPGQVHQVALVEEPSGWVFTFSKDFLAENNIPESFILNINLFQSFGDFPPLKIDEPTFRRLLGIVHEMEACLPMHLNFRVRALGALLQLFLIYCNHSSTVSPNQRDEEDAGICILRDFKNLVDKKYQEWHKVNDYASAIHISPKHLSQTVKKLTGASAKEVILARLLLEAKRLLLHTNLNIKEVAYRLGFSEPLHFSSFFKKKGGLSPSDFRKAKKS